MGRLTDMLREKLGGKIRKGSRVDKVRTVTGVRQSAEFLRIFNLPRRVLDFDKVPNLTDLFTRRTSSCPGCDLCLSGSPQLRAIQSAALWEAERARGLFAAIGVGHGKTLIDLLLPEVFEATRAVILTKPRLKSQMLDVDIPRYSRHFKFSPKRFTVVSYTELSNADKGDVLDRIKPDLVIADEMHALRNIRSAARARRMRDWREEHPEVPFCGLSGTPANDSIKNYAHLLVFALGSSRSPVPSSWHELEDWSRALDVPQERADHYPMPPGVLLDLCGPDDQFEETKVLSIDDQTRLALNPKESLDVSRALARRVYRRRLIETPGVVFSTNANDADCSLVISARSLNIPEEVQTLIDELRELWSLGDEEFSEAMDVAAKAKQLACGFYYYWDWPGGVKDQEWLDARSAWFREVRNTMRYRDGYYSPLMVWRAAESGELESEAFEAWQKVRDRWRPHPPQATRWLSDFLINDILKWSEQCSEEEPGIVWYEHAEIGERLRARGMEVYGGGSDGDRILVSKANVVAASLDAHRDGKNLQRFCRNLVTTPPASGEHWQQFMGRTHRSGQRAEEVTVDVYTHDLSFRSAINKATAAARFVDTTSSERQKLCYATRIGLDFDVKEELWKRDKLSGNRARE